MAETLYVVGDYGATESNLMIVRNDLSIVAHESFETNNEDYDGSIDRIPQLIGTLGVDSSEVVSATLIVAAAVDDTGEITQSGDLSPWIGHNIKEDVAQAIGRDPDNVGAINDVKAIALSQQKVNHDNGRPVDGIAVTISSGFGGAGYSKHLGETFSDEPGHEDLPGDRHDVRCPCGNHGHFEGAISGKSAERNHNGMSMETWLSASDTNVTQFITDASTAIVHTVDRLRSDHTDFDFEEFRWTGGVALNQPVIMNRVAGDVRQQWHDRGDKALVMDTVTLGKRAGIHGAHIDAMERAA